MILVLKLALGAVALLAVWPALRLARRRDVGARAFDACALAALAASRLTPFAVVFLVLKIQPASDVTVYFSEARAVLDGHTPMVDIETAYGFFFDYIAAAVILVWRSPVALVFFTVAIELASFALWLRAGRAGFPEARVRDASVLYILNPLAIGSAALAGQNHVWIAFFLAMSLSLLATRRDAAAGAALGASIVAVKFLGFLFAPILFLLARDRAKFALLLLIVVLSGYAVPLALGANLSRQVVFHALYPSSGSLPYLMGILDLAPSTPSARLVADLAGFLALCLSFLAALSRIGAVTMRHGVLLSAFVLVVTLLVQEKSFTSYNIIALFPTCLALAGFAERPLRVLAAQAFWTLANLEPSLWFRWMDEYPLDALWTSPLPPTVQPVGAIAFVVVEAALIAGYFALLGAIWAQWPKRAARGAGLIAAKAGSGDAVCEMSAACGWRARKFLES